jgi:hypothetical protein
MAESGPVSLAMLASLVPKDEPWMLRGELARFDSKAMSHVCKARDASIQTWMISGVIAPSSWIVKAEPLSSRACQQRHEPLVT